MKKEQLYRLVKNVSSFIVSLWKKPRNIPFIIVKDRGRGKTTQLINIANNYNGYIVCINRKEAVRVYREAIYLKKEINFPMTFDELIKKQYCAIGCKKFHIDNADLLLQQLEGHAREKTVFSCGRLVLKIKPGKTEFIRKIKKHFFGINIATVSTT